MRDAAGLVKTGIRRYASIKSRIGLGMLALLALTGVPFMLLQWIGPRAEPPAESPIERLNREHSELWPNAAHVYAEFGEFLREIPEGDLDDFVTPSPDALPAHAIAWIEEREYLADILRNASDIEKFYSAIQVDELGVTSFRQAGVARAIGKFLVLRARLQAERRDLSGFLESLLLADRVGRHVRQEPLLIAQLLAMSCRNLSQMWILIPFEWSEIEPVRLADYARAALRLCDETPTVLSTCQSDLETHAWSAFQPFEGGMEWFVPRGRVWGEMLSRIRPFHELVALPVEDWVDPNNSLRQTLRADCPPPSKLQTALNIPGAVASLFSDQAGWGNARLLALDARLVAVQRGNRAALAAWRHRILHGRWAGALSEIDASLPNEPYTRRPYIYRVFGDEMTLYAAAIDCDDDGGRHDRKFGEPRKTDEPDGDFVFWPIPDMCPTD